MKLKLIVVFVILGMIPHLISGQSYKATATLDSTSILIGDYLNVHLEVAVPKGNAILFPKISTPFFTALNSPIEWIESSKIDTGLSGDLQILKQTITITAFDSGRYIFPSIPILSSDSLLLTMTDSLFFDVHTIAVDTTAAYKDIKGNVKVPFTLHEFWLYVKKYGVLIFLIAVLIGLLIYFMVRWINKKSRSSLPVLKRQKPKEKPHLIALRDLDRLKKKKLWEQGKVKEYYSELTDIIRIYLENRWDLNAMEMVSSEILEAITTIESAQQEANRLEKLFSISDLVKFAKWDPLPTDHDMAYKYAYEFVENTADQSEITETN